MFGELMEYRVPANVNSRMIITIECDRLQGMNTQFFEESDQPSHLRGSMRHGTIFSLTRGLGNHMLLFTFPTAERRTKYNSIISD